MAEVAIHQDSLESVLNAGFSTSNPCYTGFPQGMLQDLSIGRAQNKNRACDPATESLSTFEHLMLLKRLEPQQAKFPETNPTKAKFSSRGLRRRATIEPETFEPLDVVTEESNSFIAAERSASQEILSSASEESHPNANHPLLSTEPKSPSDEFAKHLAGQFEWLITYPRPASSANIQDSSDEGNTAPTRGPLVFGCNLLARNQQSTSQEAAGEHTSANTYTLIATPLEGNAYSLPDWDTDAARRDQVNMALDLPPAYELHPSTPLKTPEVVEVFEQAVSPALTLVSERSSNLAGGSSRAASFSVPRIEDSLEELDKLEDQLEAVNAVTQSRRITSPKNGNPSKQLEPLPEVNKSTISKRSSVAGQAATLRVKNSEKTRTSIRRSTSLIFREKQNETEDSPKATNQLPRSRSFISKPTTPKGPIKSTKPPTVPNFELPGEAVARRLKEQREARKAQQAEAQKTYVAPPRPRSNKPLTKPTFELPGEAISRKKREDREARLKAQEEDARNKREFKAKPVRYSINSSTLPRDTATSRARQTKISSDDDANKQSDTPKLKRLSIGVSRGNSISNKSPQARGRLSTMASHENLSRATSSSTGSANGQRSSLSAEELQLLKQRGKEVFHRDNTRFKEDKEREKREREMATRLAREQAAERSRVASREWAEKKRRKEQALKEAMRQEM
ncbi:Fc.00g007840.m01.CDS01 [Cosmosporella sp. VM-42]